MFRLDGKCRICTLHLQCNQHHNLQHLNAPKDTSNNSVEKLGAVAAVAAVAILPISQFTASDFRSF